ncbi:MAG: S8 family serine peptidase, partial [Actinomycetota bacterium]
PERAARVHASRYGVEAKRFYHNVFKGYAARIRRDRVEALREDPSVLMVSENRRYRAAAQDLPTGVDRVDADAFPENGEGVQVAVMDTGIDLQHPDLAANIAGGIYCPRDGEPASGTFDDTNGHGSHVAGTIAAIDNADGVVGVAPKAKLWAVRVLDPTGEGDDLSLLCGLEFVFNRAPAYNGLIRVANMSIESLPILNIDDGNCGLDIGDIFHFGICLVVEAGVTMVVAAGNHNENIKDISPAAYDEVITVTALADSDGTPCGLGPVPPPFNDPDDTMAADFSNFATLVADKAHTIGAPGVNIESTAPGGGTAFMFGTSMASPHVAGAAARFIESHPGVPANIVRDALLTAAEPVGVNFKEDCEGTTPSHTDPSGLYDEPVLRVADWSIDIDAYTPGVVRGNNWYLNNQFLGPADHSIAFGSASDRKIVGDWDGDGIDTLGVVRGNVWYLTNVLGNTVHITTALGRATDRIVTGDWDGDGDDTPGVVRGNVWYLANEFDGGVDITFAFGSASDKVVVGDWDGDGHVTPGVVRGNVWFLGNASPPTTATSFAFGSATDFPIVGDWDGDLDDEVGITRGSLWALKADPFVFSFIYGLPTDKPMPGDWNGLIGP